MHLTVCPLSFALEPLLPKKLHTKSQDKLDRDEPDRERKEKKKEKRNSKHQETFDKELKTTEIPLQPAEAVILSETVLKVTCRENQAAFLYLFLPISQSCDGFCTLSFSFTFTFLEHFFDLYFLLHKHRSLLLSQAVERHFKYHSLIENSLYKSYIVYSLINCAHICFT